MKSARRGQERRDKIFISFDKYGNYIYQKTCLHDKFNLIVSSISLFTLE